MAACEILNQILSLKNSKCVNRVSVERSTETARSAGYDHLGVIVYLHGWITHLRI